MTDTPDRCRNCIYYGGVWAWGQDTEFNEESLTGSFTCNKNAPVVDNHMTEFPKPNCDEWCGEHVRYKAPNKLDNVIDAMGGEDAEEGETDLVPSKKGIGQRLLERFGGHQMRWTADVGFRFLRRPGNGR